MNDEQTKLIEGLVVRLEGVERDIEHLRAERILVQPWWQVWSSVDQTSIVNPNNKDVD